MRSVSGSLDASISMTRECCARSTTSPGATTVPIWMRGFTLAREPPPDRGAPFPRTATPAAVAPAAVAGAAASRCCATSAAAASAAAIRTGSARRAPGAVRQSSRAAG